MEDGVRHHACKLRLRTHHALAAAQPASGNRIGKSDSFIAGIARPSEPCRVARRFSSYAAGG